MANITRIDTPFRLDAPFKPTGDQPRAIGELTEGLLRGDAYQTLLGATGTGKSLGYHDPVFVVQQRGDRLVPRVTAIGPLVDALLDDAPESCQTFGETTERLIEDGALSTLAFDPDAGTASLTPVGAVMRHEAPAQMYRVRTACGRSATLTGDHNLWVLRDGALHLIETAQARPTDYVPVPTELPVAVEDGQTTLDLLALLDDNQTYVDIKHPTLALVDAEGPGAFARAAASTGMKVPYSRLAQIRESDGNGRVRLDRLHELRRITNDFGGHWDATACTVGSKNGTSRLPAQLSLTPDVLFLVGLYVAEGHSTRNMMVLANRDPKLRARVEATLDALQVGHTVRASSDYQINSQVLTATLRTLCGARSREKRLPPFWPGLTDSALGTLLRAYFDGDGSVERASAVTATTASEALASDLAYALLRFGIWARIAPVEKRATNSDHTGDTYYKVTISGQNDLARFAEYVGFSMEHKQRALDDLLHGRGNSNVEVVPIRGATLRSLRQALGWTARTLGSYGGVSRSAVQAYELDQRRPNRAVLTSMLDAMRAEAVRREMAPAWWDAWQALHRLTQVRWTPLAEVKPVDYTHPYVYDLSVPGPETFLAGAGGFFVHNTFAIANVVKNIGKPTLVLSHNKTLAAQLYAEFKEFFPNNAVEYFISYYDYYQPEAYIVSSDTYIEKDMAINEQIDRLRLSATSSLVSGRDDVIVVASVSCIYGLGNPEEYKKQIVQIKQGMEIERNELLRRFIHVFYERNDIEFAPGAFRVRGDTVDLFPAYYEDQAYRFSFWGDEIERIVRIDPLTGAELAEPEEIVTIYPAKHFVTPEDQIDRAIKSIEEELRWRLEVLRVEDKLVEAQRLEQRTLFDLEMIKEVGYCSGIENYSRHMDGRAPGTRPSCLLDYFPEDFLLVMDESHVTVPQVRGMYNGDRARKLNLVEHGFRLPSALDNRPLTYEEFERFHKNVIFVSATPADYEIEQSDGVIVEQIIRPTGILDPNVEVRPVDGQIDDLLEEIRQRVRRKERVLVTTLTKRMSEDLTEYLDAFGIRVRWLHSEIDALQRVDILRDLRLGEFDVLVGVNLLREGLDLPEVSLVAIIDADKEGFLRSERSLIQTAGRAARNAGGKVIMYANRVTDSMQRMMDETERRRELQEAYNEEHGITPMTVTKSADQIKRGTAIADHKAEEEGPSSFYSGPEQLPKVADPVMQYLTDDQKRDLVAQLSREMEEASERLEFERAAELRDEIAALEKSLKGAA